MSKPLTDYQKERVRWLHADGCSIHGISRITGMHRSSIQKILRPEKLIKAKEMAVINTRKARALKVY